MYKFKTFPTISQSTIRHWFELIFNRIRNVVYKEHYSNVCSFSLSFFLNKTCFAFIFTNKKGLFTNNLKLLWKKYHEIHLFWIKSCEKFSCKIFIEKLKKIKRFLLPNAILFLGTLLNALHVACLPSPIGDITSFL